MQHSPKESQSTMVCGTDGRVTIEHLSPDILALIFKGLHIQDLLTLQQVCRQFHEVAACSSSWKHASFFRSWPATQAELQVFRKAASHDNLEALVKLAFAKLYCNTGLPGDGNLQSMEENAWQAADYFCQAEQLLNNSFSWIFLRPPWATVSCKHSTFKVMAQWAEEYKMLKCGGLLAMSVAYTILHMDNCEYEDAALYVEQAAQQGVHDAQLMQWMHKKGSFDDKAQMLRAVRDLRTLVNESAEEWSDMLLCRTYMCGHLGGIDREQACTFTRRFFQSSQPVYVLPVLSIPHSVTPPKTRYIVVEWLVEVATSMYTGTSTLLAAVAIMDRCLLARSFCTKELQLLGISALLISSRCMENTILTIREAALYTDNTYTYEDVVEMMADIVAILRGRIKQVTSFDLLEVLKPVAGLGKAGVNLACYLLEQSMLHAYMTTFTPADIAASAVVLARILMKTPVPWTGQMEKWTGFTLANLIPCVLELHKCFSEGIPVDRKSHSPTQEDVPVDRNSHSPTQAVKMRFTGEGRIYDIPEILAVSHQKLRDLLATKYDVEHLVRSSPQLRRVQKVISPTDPVKHYLTRSTDAQRPSREDTATPFLELNTSGYDGDILNTSGFDGDSDYDGYDGDNLNTSGYDGDIDYDSDPFDLNDSCSSSDGDGEAKTGPLWDRSSEPDMRVDRPVCSPPSLISGCSQVALSSPFHVKVNLSNFSFSTSSGSTCPFSVSYASPLPHEGLPHLPRSQAVPVTAFQDDSVSMGISCTEDVSSDMSDNICVGEGAVSLKYPIMEESAGGKEWAGDRRNFGDSFGTEPGDDGVLNEAFCEHNVEPADADLPLPVPVCDWLTPRAVPGDCQRKTSISSVGDGRALFMGDGHQVEVLDHPYTCMQPAKGASPSPLRKSVGSVFNKVASQRRGQLQGADVMEGFDLPRDYNRHSYHAALASCRQSASFVFSEEWVLGNEGEEGGHGTVWPVEKRSVGGEVGPCARDRSLLGQPVVQSHPSPHHGHYVLLDGDYHATLRRQSVCFSAKMSLQFGANYTPQGRSRRSKRGEHKAFRALGKTPSPHRNHPAIPHRHSGQQGEGVRESLSTATKRKSPDSLSVYWSSRSAQTKRMRQCSSS